MRGWKNQMNWDEIYSKIKSGANKAADKLSQSADIANTQIRLMAVENRLTEAYTALGRAAYLHFTTEEDRSKTIAKRIEAVAVCLAERDLLREEIKEKRAASQKAKEDLAAAVQNTEETK